MDINRTFLANMAALWRHDPRLAQQIDDIDPDVRLAIQESRSGALTASVTTQDGRTIFLHSRYDPVKEAADFCSNLEKTEAACLLLCGLGLGYHVLALRATFGDEALIVVSEPDLVTLKTALEFTDLSSAISSGRVIFLTTLTKSTLHDRLTQYSVLLMLGTLFAVPPAARDHNSEFHAAARQAILDFAAFAKMSLVTLVRNAEITCRNIANNLPTYVSTPPPDVLRHRFAGCPAILVAAGPSLARNIDQLADVRDKAVIIAAQTTLRPLLERGIHPHFVTSLDFNEMSKQFFQNLEIPEDIVLVAEPKAAWQAVDAFVRRAGKDRPQGKVILLQNHFAHRCIGTDIARRTPMEPGSTVMHLAYYLAQWLGCDPIIFIGQDLGFTGHVYYAPGVTMHRSWTPELGRFGTLEMKEWERIARQRSILRRVKDIEGREIYTDEQMFTYLEQFERDFARTQTKIIDATEGGAQKRGAEVMTLREAAEQYCREAIDPGRFVAAAGRWRDEGSSAPAREALRGRLDELSSFKLLCEETRGLLQEMKSLLGNPTAFNARLVRVDELRTLVQRHELIFQMVREVSQLGELQKIAADHKLAALTQATRDRGERQLSRDMQFMDNLISGCSLLEQILRESVARFDEAIGGAA